MSPQMLGRGVGMNALVVAIGFTLGPVVASAVLTIASWHWLFLINIPVAILSIALSLRYLPDAAGGRQQFEAAPAALCTAFLGLLTLRLCSVENGGGAGLALLSVAVAAVCLVALLRVQRGHPAPMLAIDLLRVRAIGLSSLTSVCAFATQSLALVSLPFFLQGTMGLPVVATGLLLAAPCGLAPRRRADGGGGGPFERPWPVPARSLVQRRSPCAHRRNVGTGDDAPRIARTWRRRGRYCPSAGRLRRRIWTLSSPQHARDHEQGARKPKRRRERRGGDFTFDGADLRRGSCRPVLPLVACRGARDGAVARRRLCASRLRVQCDALAGEWQRRRRYNIRMKLAYAPLTPPPPPASSPSPPASLPAPARGTAPCSCASP
jgi:Major Facilitator Superfamily